MCDQQHDEEMLLMTPVKGTVTAVDDGECEFELENAGAPSCRPNEEIRELTEQMREMGHGKSHATSSSSGYGQDAASLAQWDPHMLIAIANRMLLRMRKMESQWSSAGTGNTILGEKVPQKTEAHKFSSGHFSTPQERNVRAPGLRTREAMTETPNSRLPEGRVAVQCYSCGKVGHLAKDFRNPGQRKVNETERHQRSSDVRQGRSFSTRVDNLVGKVTGGENLETSGKLFGPESVRIARMLEVLLDTGSEMSIMPVQVLQRARERGTDLNTYVTKIPRINAVVRNASGEIMEFVDTVCVDVVLGGESQLVPFHVGNCVDELVILGTNALELFGITLAPKKMEETADGGQMEKAQAVVKERVFIPAHSVKVVTLSAATGPGDYLFWSNSDEIEHGVCKVTGDGTAAITVWNTADEARVLHKGEVVGEWTQEKWTPTSAFDSSADLLEKGSEVTQKSDNERIEELVTILKEKSQWSPALELLIREFPDTFAVRDSELTQTNLVEHEIDTGRRHPSSVVRWGFAARFAARALVCKYTMANATSIGRVTRNDV
ncbi:unnamed protein product [Nippostrongylus brasiliensis]|uniref:CCHC-type domain-containing protein n=1 Tax=Nippostrongylus brasiliensis TaxID=27835 RepID=A0A0N4YRE5_NIPBR|nr:unnamed protein product [Nippostrongylus brasiliensis]